MPETGAAIAAWWDGLGAAATVGEAAGGAAAVGEGATELGAGMALADEAGAGLGLDATTGLTEASAAPAATEGIIPNSGPASTPLAETPAATPTQTAAHDLINDPRAGMPAQAPTGDVASKGILNSAMDWVNAKPVNTLITGQAISGVAKGTFEERAAEKKRKANLEAMQEQASLPQRLKQGNASVGGGNVNLNLRKGADGVLRRPDGTPVFGGGGILTNGMNGVRG